ncbi:glycoside hydrolase family 32 protein [Alicyclobacillus fodiniaquatilis]|uniref:Sucrose-6-phosphate hydrolase n=1 Tax=Alicyclobacillus fodiniaquatilis TaxID=1661150 RepID=A0ABW4JGE8_9BACL
MTKPSRYRLRYHLMPPVGWMNDPNGLSYFKGKYHAFYQHYPYDAKWGPMHWGHAVSADLIAWEAVPIALTPGETYDRGGCFSGSAVASDDKLYLYYTGHVDDAHPKEVQCLATSEDGIHFEKYAQNPVIAGPPADGSEDFRDPKVWRHQGLWYMVVGSGKNGRGKVLFYQSEDGVTWSYRGVLLQADSPNEGEIWECPDVFHLDGKDVLIVSSIVKTGQVVLYYVGQMDYATGRFVPETAGRRLDEGSHFYAPQTFVNAEGKRVLIGWMDLWGVQMPSQQEGWAGAMTVPRVLQLASDGHTLCARPIEALAQYGDDPSLWTAHDALPIETWLALRNQQHDLKSYTLDLTCKQKAVSSATEVILSVCASEAAGEETTVGIDLTEGVVWTDTRRSSVEVEGKRVVAAIPGWQREDEVQLQILVDVSSIEVFVNQGALTFSHRIYPGENSRAIAVHGADAIVKMAFAGISARE